MGYGQHSSHPFQRTNRERRPHLAGYRECVQAWLGGQGSGKAGCGRMFFNGKTLYSYGDHYPMACIVHKGKVCLVNCTSNSATTNKHMSIVRYEVDRVEFDAVFYLPTRVLKGWAYDDEPRDLSLHATAFDYYVSEAKESFEKSLNPRVREKNRDAACQAAMSDIATANHYADVFGLQKPFPDNAAPEAVRLAMALGDASALVAYHVKGKR